MRSKVTVINNGRESLMLEDGTTIGAAYTPEARREGVLLSELDRRRYVETGRLSLIEEVAHSPVAPKPAAATTTVSATSDDNKPRKEGK